MVSPKHPRPPEVLLAIRDLATRAKARRILESAGIAVEERLAPGTLPRLTISDDLPHSSAGDLIYIAGRASEDAAIAALRAGCRDYVRQDRMQEELPQAVERCLSSFPPALAGSSAHALIGEGAGMRRLRACVLKIAATASNVLITGETGTGKELVAQLIHANSRRRHAPLVCLNCAAIPDSLLESELFGHQRGAFTGAYVTRDGLLKQADGGTILLDEVADMSAYAQAKLLRAIETHEVQRLGAARAERVDFRVVAATNRPIEVLVESDRFRRDLYFRLSVARIELPPLRDRKEDIPLLAENFIREMNPLFGRHLEGISADALGWLLDQDWPGNIRELRNAIEAAFIDQPEGSSLLELPSVLRLRPRNGARSERDRLIETLSANNWNKAETARQLHWSRMTLYRKLAKYQLAISAAKARSAGV